MEIVLPPNKWTLEAAAHLLNRAGFGGTPNEIKSLHSLGLLKAVDTLVYAEEESDLFPPPEITSPELTVARRKELRDLSEAEQMMRKKMHQREVHEQTSALRQWWLTRMRYSSNPVREKATLFWHGHWATSIEKVNDIYLICQQNQTLRARALGPFAPFAKEMSRDPAMIRYLDLNSSTAQKPNENFARELMELFTLGEGNYTERDIQESARAFTGYRINPEKGRFHFDPRSFDSSKKSFLGNFAVVDGDKVIDLIINQPRCAEYLAEKIWTFYAGSKPTPSVLKDLAEYYRETDMNTGLLLRRIFRSRDFYSSNVVRRQIKSPVQWLVQTCKMLEVPLPASPHSENMLKQLGQNIFAPPNVKGWDGGRAWISSSTLLLRYNIAGQLVRANRSRKEAPITPPDIDAIIAPKSSTEECCTALEDRFFQARLPESIRVKVVDFLNTNGSSSESRRELLHLIMSTPEYQLT